MKTLTIFFTTLVFILIFLNCKQSKEYQVFALYFCNEGKVPAKDWIFRANQIDSVEFADYFWLLKDPNGRNILVDAGWIDSTHINKNFIRPDSILQQLNVSPQEISDIIITHPHYDHIGGISLFPNARIWMNQDDYEYFIGNTWAKDSVHSGFNRQDVNNIKTANSQGRLKLVKGDNIEIMPGIKAFTGSKHTFENMYLLVNSNSEKNKILLASDAIWFYVNLEKELPIKTFCFDTACYVKAMRRMKTLVSNPNLIIPGHDIGLMSKFPKVNNRIIRMEESKK